MNKEKQLAFNTIAYFFGSLGKGISTILIIFIGSYFISPSSLGTYDLIISTITLFQPVIIFQINDAIYRWLLDPNYDNNHIISIGIKIAVRNLIITNAIFIAGSFFFSIKYSWIVLLLLNVNCLYPIFQQITRGLKNHSVFAKSGIINAVLIITLTILFVCIFKMDILGLYLSQLVANVCSVIYMYAHQRKSIKLWNTEKYERKLGRSMIKYSAMMIPNSINQWVIKTLDKYTILLFLTTYDNGIYSVAHRFPEMLLMFINMFHSAWIEQAIVEYDSDERDSYYSKIFAHYSSFLFGLIIFLIPATKLVFPFVVGQEYRHAWEYVPIMYIGVIFFAFAAFYGTGYLSTRKTGGIMKTSLLAAVINTALNVIFMKPFGLQVAAISSCIAYFVMWIVRLIETRQYFKIKINYMKIIVLTSVCIFYALIIEYTNIWTDIVLVIISMALFILLNKKMIFYSAGKIMTKIRGDK